MGQKYLWFSLLSTPVELSFSGGGLLVFDQVRVSSLTSCQISVISYYCDFLYVKHTFHIACVTWYSLTKKQTYLEKSHIIVHHTSKQCDSKVVLVLRELIISQ